MANQTITDTEITVHGRGSLVIPYKVKNAGGIQQDYSARILYFEVDGVPIREQLEEDPSDPLGLLIKLERTQVATLKKTPTRFAVIDETDSANDIFTVLWEGTIVRTGYVGAPDTTDDA